MQHCKIHPTAIITTTKYIRNWHYNKTVFLTVKALIAPANQSVNGALSLFYALNIVEWELVDA